MADRPTPMPDDVSVRGVVVGALAIAGGVAASLGLAFLLVHAARIRSGVPPPRIATQPALQAAPAQDMAAYRVEKQRQLLEYAWVDRERGIVRIPIERAMALALQRQAP